MSTQQHIHGSPLETTPSTPPPYPRREQSPEGIATSQWPHDIRRSSLRTPPREQSTAGVLPPDQHQQQHYTSFDLQYHRRDSYVSNTELDTGSSQWHASSSSYLVPVTPQSHQGQATVVASSSGPTLQQGGDATSWPAYSFDTFASAQLQSTSQQKADDTTYHVPFPPNLQDSSPYPPVAYDEHYESQETRTPPQLTESTTSGSISPLKLENFIVSSPDFTRSEDMVDPPIEEEDEDAPGEPMEVVDDSQSSYGSEGSSYKDGEQDTPPAAPVNTAVTETSSASASTSVSTSHPRVIAPKPVALSKRNAIASLLNNREAESQQEDLGSTFPDLQSMRENMVQSVRQRAMSALGSADVLPDGQQPNFGPAVVMAQNGPLIDLAKIPNQNYPAPAPVQPRAPIAVRTTAASSTKRRRAPIKVDKMPKAKAVAIRRTVYQGMEIPGDVPRNFVCEQCRQMFIRREHLARHIKTAHGSGRVYECDICGKQLSRSDNLRAHLKAHERKGETKQPEVGDAPAVNAALDHGNASSVGNSIEWTPARTAETGSEDTTMSPVAATGPEYGMQPEAQGSTSRSQEYSSEQAAQGFPFGGQAYYDGPLDEMGPQN